MFVFGVCCCLVLCCCVCVCCVVLVGAAWCCLYGKRPYDYFMFVFVVLRCVVLSVLCVTKGS